MTVGRMLTAYLCRVVLIFLVASTASISCAALEERNALSQSATGANLVRFVDGLLSVRVKDIPAQDLLGRISQQTGLMVKTSAPLEQLVSLEFSKLPIHEALGRILTTRSFILQFHHRSHRPSLASAGRLNILWVFAGNADRNSNQDDAGRTNRRSYSEPGDRSAWMQRALSSPDPDDRMDAVSELGDNGDNAAIAELSVALTDENVEVRAAAVSSLLEIGGPVAAQTLSVALGDQEPWIREEAIDALGEMGGGLASALLQQALGDEVSYVREAASAMLQQLSDGPNI